MDTRIDEEIRLAHPVLIRWADLESNGSLETLRETQLQGDFLADVFGNALGYRRAAEGATSWGLEQHHAVGTQTPDAVLGHFALGAEPKIAAVVELKGATVHLDLGRSNSRTPVDQCWDYLVNLPTTCRWGIVSNFVSFRLYERNSTKRRYEHFSLQSLRDVETFRQFYVLFHYNGLVQGKVKGPPQTASLLRETSERQRAVGDELYQSYSQKRTDLIQELHLEKGHPLPDAIEWAQRLFDRVIFIAFCEDRDLLPPRTLETAHDVKGFSAVTNPRWQSFKALFRMVDVGGPAQANIPAYNGGLFAKGPVDDLELDDEKYTSFFKNLGTYDFADEVNLDVLGHLFERSITEVEKLKESGFFGGDATKAQAFARMPQSAKRKRLGIYYTPPELTSRIVQYTVDELIDERFKALPGDPDAPETALARLAVLRSLKIVDPACGSGAFLFQAYDALELRYGQVLARLPEFERRTAAAQVPHFILNDNLYGVDLSPEAVEITQLALWIRSADRTQKLARLSHNIVHGNSLVADPAVDPHAFDWKQRFPEVFDREESGFDCVIGNPPWERAKLEEKLFFALPAPHLAGLSGRKRKAAIRSLEQLDPELYRQFLLARENAARQLSYFNSSGLYPNTGTGDTNLFSVFTELASQLVSPNGCVGLLVPSAVASNKTGGRLFATLFQKNRVKRFFDFVNRKRRFFSHVHASYRFAIFNFMGCRSSSSLPDFMFNVEDCEKLAWNSRHVTLTSDDVRLISPATQTLPIFEYRRDAEITKALYKRVSILINKRAKRTGNPWGVRLLRKFDQDTFSEHFVDSTQILATGATLVGNVWQDGAKCFVPLYEGKMVRAFDHRAASAITQSSNLIRQGQKAPVTLVEHQNPEFLIQPRFWIDGEAVAAEYGTFAQPYFITFKKITSRQNRRTMIAAAVPPVALIDSLPFVVWGKALSDARKLCLLSNWNSYAYDYLARQKVQGTHLQHYHVEQIPTISPERYEERCPWSSSETLETWISQRVLKLTCTAEDMLPLAEACGFTGGSFKAEYGGRLNKWNERERAELMAELDAAYFHLYGLNRDDTQYVLSTFKGIHEDNPLLSGHPSTAQYIVQLYDRFAS